MVARCPLTNRSPGLPESISSVMPLSRFLPFPPAAALLAISSGTAIAQTIDFETLPNGTPTTGGNVIANQYNVAPYGVSFRFEDGSKPVIRKVGGFNANTGKPTAFRGWPHDSGNNTPAPSQNVGTYFLTDDASVNAPPPPLVVTYTMPVAAASAPGP